MSAKIRATILFSAAGVAVCAYALMSVASLIGRHQERQSQIEREIGKVSRHQYAYGLAWEKLTDEHGSPDAALAALRSWAGAMIDYRENELRWKNGLAIRPELPKALVNFSTTESRNLYQLGCEIPYGCSQTLNGRFRKWDAPNDGKNHGVRVGDFGGVPDEPAPDDGKNYGVRVGGGTIELDEFGGTVWDVGKR